MRCAVTQLEKRALEHDENVTIWPLSTSPAPL